VEKAHNSARRELETRKAKYQATNVELSDFLTYVKEILRRATQAQQLLVSLAQRIRIGRKDKLVNLVLLTLVAKDRVRDFLALHEQEAKRLSELSRLLNQLRDLKKDTSTLKQVVDRVEEALKAIRAIKQHHSLEELLESFFRENLNRINAIFQMIHSPREFEEIQVRRGQDGRGSEVQLKRKDGQLVGITQISTGQRAALALAIFFALNEKLETGPQLILLDDPVSHIDDLNALAFFDYLREVVLTRKRQIVYATANDKMASLFSRKFEFLKENLEKRELTAVETLA
jgi:ABC-type lipoprotein export system ATPase subunit